jgi:hypothetical protein
MPTPNLSALAGLWEADLERCHLMGPPPRRILMKIAHIGDELKHAILVTRADGNEQRMVVAYRSVRPGNRGEVIIEMTYGDRVLRDYWSLSDDGQTLTMAHRDDDLAGQTTVLERRGQAAIIGQGDLTLR